MATTIRRLRTEGGATLIEVLLGVVIIGITFAALMGGIATSQMATEVHRRQATGETALRSYAEAISQAPYQTCATTYSAAYTPPAGYTASIVGVVYWDGASGFTSGCTTDRGLQIVTVRVVDDNETIDMTLNVGKRRT